MARQQSTSREEDFLRAYHDMMLDTEIDRTLLIDTSMRPTGRRGVLTFTWEVCTFSADPPRVRPLCRYSAEYPNATAQSMGAFLFACATKLSRLVDDALAARADAPAPDRG